MKLSLNGALTIGTLDGANVEIKEEVGEENIFIFGLTVEEVTALVNKGLQAPATSTQANEELRAVVDWVGSNYFTPDEPGVLSMLRDNLIHSDPFLCLADFQAYSECQKKVDAAFREKSALGEDGHPQHRPHGQILQRPHHLRIRPRNLESGSDPRLELQMLVRKGSGAAVRQGPAKKKGPAPNASPITSIRASLAGLGPPQAEACRF